MPSVGLEILGVTLAVLGWILAIVSCALPMWRVSAFIGMNIVTAQITWEGIWMNCVVQSTGQMQCKIHDSMLALSADLQAARALTIISIVVGIVGVLVAMMGAKCTNCVEEESAKAQVMIAAGVAFILASLTQLIPVSWSAHSIIMEFYNPVIPEAQKREIGAALYLGWAAAAFLLIGGGILCSSCPPQPEKRYGPPSKMMYSQTRSIAPSGYDRRDYVWSHTCSFLTPLPSWERLLKENWRVKSFLNNLYTSVFMLRWETTTITNCIRATIWTCKLWGSLKHWGKQLCVSDVLCPVFYIFIITV